MEEFDGIARVLASGVADRLDGQPRAGRCKIPKSKCRRGRRGPWLHQIVLLGSGGRRLRGGRTVFPAHQMEEGMPVVCEHFFRTIVSQMLVATKKKKFQNRNHICSARACRTGETTRMITWHMVIRQCNVVIRPMAIL